MGSRMRIRSIDAVAIDIPLTRNFGGSTYAVRKRSTVITRLQTEDGIVGEVYNGDNRDGAPQIVRLIREELAPAIKGCDVFDGERIWAKLFALGFANRDRKLLMEAIACVDCALWDAIGKATGRRVRDLLGGYAEEVPVISIGGYYMEGCKFKVGGLSPRQDAERVAAARKAAGADFILAVDANRGWSADQAIEFARLIEPLDIRWFEEPSHWYDDAAQMARVRTRTSIPVTAGQSETTSHGVRRLIDAGAVDIVNYDASEGGGVTEWRRAAALCATAGLAMAHHEESQIALQLISAVPHGTYVECFADPERDPVWQRMWLNRPPAKDGMMTVAPGAGFGLELDQAMIARYAVS